MEDTIRKAIYDKYIEPTKRKRPDYIGVEIEMPVVNLANAPVDESVSLDTAKQFTDHFGFQVTGHNAAGNFTSAQYHPHGEPKANPVQGVPHFYGQRPPASAFAA